jgi:hypothetical protein
MRFLSLLKRYWFYSLAWLAGLWLLWVMTPVRPNVASTIYEGQEFIGFVDGGRAFVTLNLTRTDSNPLGVRERRISHGPVSIRNTETGIVERSFFSTDDRFVNLLVEPNRDHLLRCLRKQGKTSAGDFKYVLEWIDVRTGKTFASFNPVTHAEAPKGLSPLFPAALSYDGQCAFYYSLFDNKEQIVCDECDNGKRAFAPDQRVNIPYSAFSPDSRSRCHRGARFWMYQNRLRLIGAFPVVGRQIANSCT